MFKEKYLSVIIFIMLVFLTLYYYNDIIWTSYRHSRDTQMRMAVVGTLGGPSFPVIAQYGTSRNLVEGIHAGRSDLPGGFCFHSSCDVVVTSGFLSEKVYKIKVLRK